jgi:hypothetical protein
LLCGFLGVGGDTLTNVAFSIHFRNERIDHEALSALRIFQPGVCGDRHCAPAAQCIQHCALSFSGKSSRTVIESSEKGSDAFITHSCLDGERSLSNGREHD